MRRPALARGVLLGLAVGALAGCLKAWDVGGPWACTAGACAAGLTCDDGVCCVPGGVPACPTLPTDGGCPDGLTPTRRVRDLDEDGTGDERTRRPFCREPQQERWVLEGGDCDDTQAAIGPTVPERCNAVDDDCDGVVDDGLRLTTFFRDEDGDGFGVASDARQACVAPPGYAASAGDCAPGDPGTHPGAPERCNGNDDNCNGQPDDPPFEDAESPGANEGAFPCTAGVGECEAGGWQCVFAGEDAGFQRTCVARRAPAPDTCGNGRDEDCNGVADDRPGCGGPQNVFAMPGVSFGAIAVRPADIGTLPTRCLKGTPGATGMAWLNPTWVMSSPPGGSDLQVWWAEAPAGTSWDVSQASAVRFAVRANVINPNLQAGIWGTTRFPNAVVALCGVGGEAVRYVPGGAAQVTGSEGASSPAVLDVPLNPPAGSAWTRSGNAGVVLPRVVRVELWFSPEPPDAGTVTVTNTFVTDAGLQGFR